MGSPRFFWAVTVAVPSHGRATCALAQTSTGMRSSDLGRNGPAVDQDQRARPPESPRDAAARGPSQTQEEPRSATNDWNPHYLKGKAYFIQGHYDQALTELERNVADCDQIDFESMRRQQRIF